MNNVWHRPLVWVTRNIREALKGANAPSADNPFVTAQDIADLGGGGSPSGIQYVDVQLNNSQILNLKAAPVNCGIPAPDSGFAILPLSIDGVADFQDNYDLTSDRQLNLYLGSNQLNDLTVLRTALGNISDQEIVSENAVAFQGILSTWTDALIGGQQLFIGNNGADEWFGGHADNTLSLRISYSIVPTLPFGGA